MVNEVMVLGVEVVLDPSDENLRRVTDAVANRVASRAKWTKQDEQVVWALVREIRALRRAG